MGQHGWVICIILSEISQSQRDKCCLIPVIWDFWNRFIEWNYGMVVAEGKKKWGVTNSSKGRKLKPVNKTLLHIWK